MNESLNNITCATCKRLYRSESDFLTGTSRWRQCNQGHLWFNCSCSSTLVISRGRFPWYTPDLFFSDDARGVFNRISALKSLPHLPSALMEIQQTLEKAETTPRDIAKAIKHDPFIAAQILKIAECLRLSRNSLTPSISSLEHAIVYIGYKSLSDILTTATLHALKLPQSRFSQKLFWRESYLIGMVSEFLCKRLSLEVNADEAFLSGSLCNVGKLVTAFCFPEVVSKILAQMSEGKTLCSWNQAEHSQKAPAHSILGEIAACIWGLPDYVLVSTRRHHEVANNYRGPHTDLVDLAAAANQMVHIILDEPHRVEPEIIARFQKTKKLNAKDMRLLERDLKVFYQKIAANI